MMNDPILLRTAIRERIAQLNEEARYRMFFTKSEGKRLTVWKDQDGKKTPMFKSKYTVWGLHTLLNDLNNLQIIFI